MKMSGKLTLRDWQDGDWDKVAELHAKMAPGYSLPANLGPLFFVRKAVVDENGKMVAAATVKLVGEAFLWQNDEFSSLVRLRAVKLLNAGCGLAAKQAGLEEVSAWIPTRLLRCFRRALIWLGWQKSAWRTYSIRL